MGLRNGAGWVACDVHGEAGLGGLAAFELPSLTLTRKSLCLPNLLRGQHFGRRLAQLCGI